MRGPDLASRCPGARLRDAIAAGGNFEASVAQDFKGIGSTAADTLARVLGGEVLKANVIYVPTQLVTSVNAK